MVGKFARFAGQIPLRGGHIGGSDLGISEEKVKNLGISDMKMKNLGISRHALYSTIFKSISENLGS